MEPTGNENKNRERFLNDIEQLPEEIKILLTELSVDCWGKIKKEPSELGKESMIFLVVCLAYMHGTRSKKG